MDDERASGGSVSDTPRRRRDRILEPSYASDLTSLAVEELRQKREECEQVEAELSYTRRLLQGKLDILRHGLEVWAEGEDAEIEGIRERLPEILGESGGAREGLLGRPTRILVPANAERQRREVEQLASEYTLTHVDELSEEELSRLVDRLKGAEAESSEERRAVQDTLDRIKAELVTRYREGKDDPTAILSS
jgi:hypothetical protein